MHSPRVFSSFRSLTLTKVAIAMLATLASVSAYSSTAPGPSGLTESDANGSVTFPTVDWTITCGSDANCHTFDGSKDLDNDHQVSPMNASSYSPKEGSYGWQFGDGYPYGDDKSRLSNQTLIAHDISAVKNYFVTTGAYGGDGNFTADGNRLYLIGNSTTPALNWSMSDSSDATSSSQITAVSINWVSHSNQNFVGIKDYTVNVDSNTGSGTLNISATSPTLVSVANATDKATFNNNQLVIENSTIHGNQGYTDAVFLYGVYSGSFRPSGEDYDPSYTTLDGNGVFIRGSKLDVTGIHTIYRYSGYAGQATGNTLWIDDSAIQIKLNKGDGGYKNARAHLVVAENTPIANQNVLYVNQSTIRYDQVDQSTSLANLILTNVYVGYQSASDNHLVVRDSTIENACASSATILSAAMLNRANITDTAHLIANNRVGLEGVNHPTQLSGSAPVFVYGAYVIANGELTQNAIDLNNVQVQVPVSLNAIRFDESRNFTLPATGSENSLTVKDTTFDQKAVLVAADYRSGADVQYDASKTVALQANQLLIENSILANPTSEVGGARVDVKGATLKLHQNHVEIGAHVVGANQQILTLKSLFGALHVQDPMYWGQDNTLTLRSPVVVTDQLAGFQTYQFDLSEGVNGQAFLRYQGKDPVRLCVNSEDANHSTFVLLGLPSEGIDTVALIHSEAGFSALDPTEGTETRLQAGDHSDLIDRTVVVKRYRSFARQSRLQSDDTLTLTIENNASGVAQDLILSTGNSAWVDEANDQTSALMESALSSLGALTTADDLFMDQALRDQVLTQEGPFVAARTGCWSFDTNTRIESNITSAVMGYGHEVGERTHVGLFVEMGLGAYKTRTGLSDGTTSQGSGSQNYAGLGLFAMQKLPIEGLHLNGYVKAGGLQNRFDITMMDQGLAFNRTAAYWGANLGVMFDYPLTANVATRSYLQYFYDGLGSQTFDKVASDLAITSSFHYDAINAHRIQLGTQVTYNYQPNLKPFIGLALEDAIQAKATGTATDSQGTLAIKPSDMEGVTALLSAGWKYESEDQGLNVGLSATGYGGARNGVSAQVQATWAF